MKILVIGATGNIGKVVASTLDERGHDVIRASRNAEFAVDITEPASIKALFEKVERWTPSSSLLVPYLSSRS